jgi:predicted Fe-Mo cluster-binding NifX family protein
MKIAVTSLGETMDSPVDQRFGRARYFVLVDTATGEWSAHENSQNLEAAQGAGIQAGQTVANLGAEAVLTGHCGPKAFRTLAAGGVAVYTGTQGTVEDAVSDYRAGKLQKAGGADVAAHAGSV